MEDKFKTLAPDVGLTSPATQNAIKSLLDSIDHPLPKQYLDFLRISNGAEGNIGKISYISLWPAEEIKQLNEGYLVKEFAPFLLLFGSDGGGMGYAFDLRSEEMPILELPLDDLDLEYSKKCGNNFEEFLVYLASDGYSSDDL